MSPVLETTQDRGILSGMDAASTTGTSESASGAWVTADELPLGSSSSAQASSGEPGSTANRVPKGSLAGSVSATPLKPFFGCEADLCTLAHTEAVEPVLPDAQRRWSARALSDRLQIIRKARHWMAEHPIAFAKAISPDLARTEADTLTSELLPLLEAMRFLERRALKLLAPTRLGSRYRPVWLAGVHAEIHRDPLGHVLVIGPANFPLFLPGVQVIQALVAGNAVTWKPGTGGQAVAELFTHVLREAGLPRGILHVTEETVEAAQHALAHRPDKVVFTGSFETGTKILATLAETATPSTMELSGADAVVVLPSADLNLVAKAVAFGLRLNGAEVCMSPRRLVATRETLKALDPLLQAELAKVPAVPLKPKTARLLNTLLQKSTAQGAELLALAPASSHLSPHSNIPSPLSSRSNVPFLSSRSTAEGSASSSDGEAEPVTTRPILLDKATPQTAITRTDLFAPVLSLIEAPSVLHLADIVNDNPYALTAAIFGDPREAQILAAQLRTGTVLINDLIAPTADPRVHFGGRGSSGFGVTRGAEGLLEMTAAKTILLRRKGVTRHYDPLGPGDLPLFAGLIGALHGGSFRQRWRSLQTLISAARTRTR